MSEELSVSWKVKRCVFIWSSWAAAVSCIELGVCVCVCVLEVPVTGDRVCLRVKLSWPSHSLWSLPPCPLQDDYLWARVTHMWLCTCTCTHTHTHTHTNTHTFIKTSLRCLYPHIVLILLCHSVCLHLSVTHTHVQIKCLLMPYQLMTKAVWPNVTICPWERLYRLSGAV